MSCAKLRKHEWPKTCKFSNDRISSYFRRKFSIDFINDLLSLACMHVSANRKILNIRTCELCVCLRIVVLFQYEGQWSWESVNVTFCSRSAIAQTPHCSRTRCHWFCIWNGSHFLKKSSKRHNLILPAYHGQ